MSGQGANSDAMQPLKITLNDLPATSVLADRLASMLCAGDVIALSGDLGAGKTTFARALIQRIGGQDTEVPSPTFTLVQTYDLPDFEIWHFDLYRLEAPRDAFELDIEEAFVSGVSLIEWPDRLGPNLPSTRLDIIFAFGEEASVRKVTIKGHGGWVARLEKFHDG